MRRKLAQLSAVVGLVCLAGVPSAQASRRVFLWFADGGEPPASVREICLGGRPPAFRCVAGPVETCRQAILAHLDRWYAAVDVVFSFAAPTEGLFDTVALTSDGAWCDADARTVSRSPLPLCTAVPKGSIAIFRCGDDAKACATLVAKEQAHLLGLQHSASATDVMNEVAGTLHDGFEDRDNTLTSAKCGRQQNSYRLLLERAGRWPGGPKPDPGAPVVAVDAGADAAGSDDAALPVIDAGAEADVTTPVDAGATSDVAVPGSPLPGKPRSGGCAFAGRFTDGHPDNPVGAGTGAPSWLFLALATGLGLARQRVRRRRENRGS
ncbi:MAG TPA: hypothetical protein VGG33_20585 [Polyangia bacterium]